MDYLPDANARMLKIQGGEADIAEGVPFTQIEQIEGSEGITVEVTTSRRGRACSSTTRSRPSATSTSARR